MQGWMIDPSSSFFLAMREILYFFWHAMCVYTNICVYLLFPYSSHPILFMCCCASNLIIGICQSVLDNVPPNFYFTHGSRNNQPTVSTKPFRVSSTNRSMDSMPGTPATFASYCDPASPASASSHHPHSRSNSLVAKMDMEIGLVGAGGGCNDSDDGGVGGPSGTKSLLMSKT